MIAGTLPDWIRYIACFELWPLLSRLWPLLSTTLAAQLAISRPVAHVSSQNEVGALADLIETQAQIDPDTALATINADRSVAGFPRVDRDLFDRAL
jgi:hypothetical protein